MIPRPPRSTPFPYTTLFRSSPSPIAAAPEAASASPPSTRRARTPCGRSEEHTSELQSHHDLVCRLLLEKRKAIDEIRADAQEHQVIREGPARRCLKPVMLTH